jgi:hypothetical protein
MRLLGTQISPKVLFFKNNNKYRLTLNNKTVFKNKHILTFCDVLSHCIFEFSHRGFPRGILYCTVTIRILEFIFRVELLPFM